MPVGTTAGRDDRGRSRRPSPHPGAASPGSVLLLAVIVLGLASSGSVAALGLVPTRGRDSATATLPVTTTQPCQPNDDAYLVQQGIALVVPAPGVLANDGDCADEREYPPFAVGVDTLTTHGVVSLQDRTGAFTYTPDAGFTGVDSFTYGFFPDSEARPAALTAGPDDFFGTATVTLDVTSGVTTTIEAPTTTTTTTTAPATTIAPTTTVAVGPAPSTFTLPEPDLPVVGPPTLAPPPATVPPPPGPPPATVPPTTVAPAATTVPAVTRLPALPPRPIAAPAPTVPPPTVPLVTRVAPVGESAPPAPPALPVPTLPSPPPAVTGVARPSVGEPPTSSVSRLFVQMGPLAVRPGQDLVVHGGGCRPDQPVTVSVTGGAVTDRPQPADHQGRFELVVHAGVLAVGRHEVEVACGARRQVAFDVATTSESGGGVSSTLFVFVFIAVSGLVLFRRQSAGGAVPVAARVAGGGPADG